MYRHEPLFARVLDLLRGDADRPAPHDQRGLHVRPEPAATTFGSIAALGGGSLWDVGCYAGQRGRWLIGRRRAGRGVRLGVHGRQRRRRDRSRACFDSPATSWRPSTAASAPPIAPGSRSPARTESLRVANPFKPVAARRHRDARAATRSRRVAVEGSSLLFVRQVEDFVAAALDGRAPAVSLARQPRQCGRPGGAVPLGASRAAGPAMMMSVSATRANRPVAALSSRGASCARGPAAGRTPSSR